jgi:hypothetical protein
MHQQFVLDAAMEMSPSQNSSLHLPDLETMDGILAVFSLINMAELANVLHPDTYQEGVDPEERMFLIHVRKQARDLAHWLNSYYSIEPAACAGTVSRTTRETPHVSYLFHQACALQDAKMSMEEAGLQSAIPGLTYQALRGQLLGCLGIPVRGRQEQGDTFDWDKDTYKVTRRRKPLQTRFCMCTFDTFTKPCF